MANLPVTGKSGALDAGWNRPHWDADADAMLEWVGWEGLCLRPVRVDESVHFVSSGRICSRQIPDHIILPSLNVQVDA